MNRAQYIFFAVLLIFSLSLFPGGMNFQTISNHQESVHCLTVLSSTAYIQPNATGTQPPAFRSIQTAKNSPQTVLILPESKEEILTAETLLSGKAMQLDRYLAERNIQTQNNYNKRNHDPDDEHEEIVYELEDLYKPAANKYLGIWTNYLTPRQCINLGFNEYFVNYNTDIKELNSAIESAHREGFDYYNIMVNLGTGNINNAKYILENSSNVGLYFIDEPVEHKIFNGMYEKISTILLPALLKKNPAARLLLSSYHVPEGNICGNAVGDKYLSLMENNNNVCIQCDKYTLNCCGNVPYYWDEFQKYYGINRNFSNWMNVTVNNGSTPGDFPCSAWPFPNSADWTTLFKSANSYGMNNVWLFAEGTGNKFDVMNYSRIAWKNGWLVRKGKSLIIFWKQKETGLKDNWPKGNWYIDDAYYIGHEIWINYNNGRTP